MAEPASPGVTAALPAAPAYPAVKFCGMTRPEDVACAAALGASYVGVIFAGGPRLLAPHVAAAVLAGRGTARAVGVFGSQAPTEVGAMAREAGIDVVQLHGDPDAAMVHAVRRHFPGEVWGVARCEGAALPGTIAGLLASADAVVLDARVPGALGGTGVAIPWLAIRDALAALRGGGRLVLAGGLEPGNVAEAVSVLAPAVVDVSSGVERAPGVKDHERMRAFWRAATGGEGR